MKSFVPLTSGLLVVAALAITACARETPPTATAEPRAEAPAVVGSALPGPIPPITITSTPPKDLASRSATPVELAQFAWQEFLALSWKSAIDPGESPAGLRGVPDPTWDYSAKARTRRS